jgi:hypothetical protein
MTDGAIYVATGSDYLDLARASAATLKHHNPGLAVDVFTDCPDVPGLEVFDAVHAVPHIHPRAKIDCMPLSRFDRTLYLDCDTLILAPFGDLFDLMRRFELALAHDMRRASDLVQEGHAERTPYAFPQLNSGVMLYRRSPAMSRFFADWSARYRAAGTARDQVTLKDLLWASDLRFYVLPTEFNLRRVPLLAAWEPLDARPTILHSHRLLDHLRKLGVPRVRSLGEVVTLERAALAAEWSALGLDEDDRRDTERLLSLLGTVPAAGGAARPLRPRKAAI